MTTSVFKQTRPKGLCATYMLADLGPRSYASTFHHLHNGNRQVYAKAHSVRCSVASPTTL